MNLAKENPPSTAKQSRGSKKHEESARSFNHNVGDSDENINEKRRLEPDAALAESFLTLLDESAEQFTFQLFHDSKDKQPAYIKNGTLGEHLPFFIDMQQEGYGVFVTVNETNLCGRKKSDITRIRSLWMENDRQGLPPLPDDPHIRVESSPGKYHEYFLTDGGPLDEFDSVQERLVRDYGSDPNAKDISRVLRLPGFYHLKDPDSPHLVRIVDTSGAPPMSWVEAKRLFPPVTRGKAKIEDTAAQEDINRDEVIGAINTLDPDMDYMDWLSIGMAVHSGFNGNAEGLKIWDEWSRTGQKYRDDECEYRYRTFSKKEKGITIKSLYKMAYQAGWKSSGDYNPGQTASGDTGADYHHGTAVKVIHTIGEDNIVNDGNQTWLYRDEKGIWEPADPKEIKQYILRAATGYKVTKTANASVYDLIETLTYRMGHTWNPRKDVICCVNGVLRWVEDDILGWDWQLSDFNRDYYCTSQIPVEYTGYEATCPKFDQFLDEIFSGDADTDAKKSMIFEMIGYAMLATAKYEKFFILVGEGANGKSVLLLVIKFLLGRTNVSAVQPDQLGNKFQRAHLQGKLANLITEIPEGQVLADADLKSLTSGEITTAEHKFRAPFEFEPFSTIIMATNHLPHTRDFSKALFRRAIILPFNRVFSENEQNKDLAQELIEELPGIFVKSLDAIGSVIASGGIFTTCNEAKEVKREWAREANQAHHFVEDCCRDNKQAKETIGALYDAYKNWADDLGIQMQLSKKSLSRRIKSLGFERTTKRTRYGKQARAFAGIQLV